MTHLARTLGFVCCALVAPAVQAQDWPMFQGTPGRGAAVGGPALSGGGTWWQRTGPLNDPIHVGVALLEDDAVSIAPVPSADFSSIVATAITRFDPATGMESWRVDRSDGEASLWIAVAGDKVIYATTSNAQFDLVGPYKDRIVALNLADGSEAWSYVIGDKVPGAVTPGAVFGGEVIFTANVSDSGTGELILIRLDAETGGENLRMVIPGAGSIVPNAVAVGDNGWAHVSGMASSGFVAAYDQSGVEQWKNTSTSGYFNTPIVADGVVFAGNVEGFVDAFDAASGAPLGRWQSPNGASINQNMVHDPVQAQLYVFDEMGLFALALDPTGPDLAQVWYRAWTAAAFEASGILGGGEQIYAYGARSYVDEDGITVDTGDLIAYSATGAKLWTAEVGAPFTIQPALAAGRLVMTTAVTRFADPPQIEIFFNAFGDLPDDPLLVCQADLAVCLADAGLCEGDLANCESEAGACGEDLDQCEADSATCAASLTTCAGDRDQCLTDLGSCEEDLGTSETELGICEDEATQCLGDLGVCEQNLAQSASDLALCGADLSACDGALGECQGEVSACETDLAASAAALQDAAAELGLCDEERESLEAEVTALGEQVTALGEALAQCEAGQDTGTAEVAAAMNELRAYLRTLLRDPSYELPGDTPTEQLHKLVDAIEKLPPGAVRLLAAALQGHPPAR